MTRFCCDNKCRQGRDCPNRIPRNFKFLWYKIERQFTLVEWLVILLIAVFISIGLYKGIVWMILKSMTGSTFYQVMMKG
jgi:uncharacterized membrane protein